MLGKSGICIVGENKCQQKTSIAISAVENSPEVEASEDLIPVEEAELTFAASVGKMK